MNSPDQASLRELHNDMAALAEDMRRPTPTAPRAALLPFALGAGIALATVLVVTLVARLV